MADTLKKVQTGQRLHIPARAYNAFIDAAHDHQRRSTQIEGSSRPTFRQADIVLVRNDSGSDQPRLSVLGIDEPIIPPDTNPDEFQNRVALSCVTPAAGVHEGRFVVLADPIAAGKMGRAYAAGVCPVEVNVPDEDHDYRLADIGDGVTGSLAASLDGSAAILWREGGTGVQWAVVRLGRPGPDAAKFDRGTITDNSSAPDHTVNTVDNGSVTATEINGWTLLEGTDVFVWKQDGTWYLDGAYSERATDSQHDIDETAADSWDVEAQPSNEIGVKWSCLVPYQGDLLNTARLWFNEIEVFTDGRGNVIHVATTVDSGHIDFTHHIEDADWHNVQGGNPAEGTLLRYDDGASRWMYLEPPTDDKWLYWGQGSWNFGYPDHEFFTPVPDPRDGDSADPFHRNVDDSNVDTSASGIIVLRPNGQASRTWEFLSTSGVDEGKVLAVQADESLDWQEASGGGFSKLVKVNQAGTTPDVQECDEHGATAGGDTYDNVGVIHGMHCPGNTMGLLIKDKDGNNVFLPHDFV